MRLAQKLNVEPASFFYVLNSFAVQGGPAYFMRDIYGFIVLILDQTN